MSSWLHSTTITPSLTSLLLLFVAWKTILLIIASASPGIGYDTSSDLLAQVGTSIPLAGDVPVNINHSVLRLVRWDAIYYTEIARKGHIHEQQWAFGKGLSTVLVYVTTQLLGLAGSEIKDYAIAGILVSHVSHFLSVVLLYATVRSLHDLAPSHRRDFAFVASILHVLSPAGIFLSSPYSESLFSFWNMLGYYLYVRGTYQPVRHGLYINSTCIIAAGVSFGVAAAIRGNGVLSGIPFFIDAIEAALRFISPRTGNAERLASFVQLLFTVLAGLCVAVGFVYPQFLAYREYCIDGPADRPWCRVWLPSIYTFVQSHYWNVGFLRYWTVSNLPLFLLAAPCLGLLTVSGWQGTVPGLSSCPTHRQKIYLRLALPQLILSLSALTSYHVQIITRLSSGYPFWYMWMAARIETQGSIGILVRVLVMYGLIQAGLYASFLPPA